MTYETSLQEIYGFSELRPSQQVIIDVIMTGEDVLALMPTGGGKSLCYQLPVILSGGKALVITPLISLMEDQVAELKRLRLKAACIHSYLDIREKRMILNSLHDYQFIFCSPEWLATEQAKGLIDQIMFTHVVIDEAHCISEWGFDFRPHYLLLHEILKEDNQVIALTATADEKIITDILHLLKRELKVIDERTERSNIFLSVEFQQDKLKYIESLLDDAGPVIIYFSSKKICDDIHHKLAEKFSGMTYHADMTYEERMTVQTAFYNDRIQYVCATSAFGMGINKKNIRTVIHYHVPKSKMQYVQEIGRAGRDGLQAHALLLFDEEDIYRSYRFLQEDSLSEADLNSYLNGALLPEEKKEQLQILTSLFSEQQLRYIIDREYQSKKQALMQMAEYGNASQCLGAQLYHADAPCGYCQFCWGKRTFQFEKMDIPKICDDMKGYINALFNL
ncbi:ATP-dependent DNA helicase RecQ [Macrococcus hajekii]|nr:RecQ family ATP-dependent DNA helicase [Macrococcus hajekii]GGB05457.1 ATP-dependent DNA helicase RecQ [Macrococcus hajekii]